MKRKDNKLCGGAAGFLLMLLLLPVAPRSLADTCGKERWPVKTLQDPGADNINFATQDSTVENLREPKPPDGLRKMDNSVRLPEEQTVYQVEALLVGFKKESDQDYHLVLADPSDKTLTMIAEIPDPDCASEQYAREFNQAREFVEEIHKPSKKFYRLKHPIPVTVTGVFFFDFIHGQTGVAPNGAELHPIFTIEKSQ